MSEPRDAGPPPRPPGSTGTGSAEPFRELVECCPDYITLHDLEGRLLYGNPAVQRIVGRPMAGRVGTRPVDSPETAGPVMTAEFAGMFQSRIEQVVRSGQPVEGEFEWPDLFGAGPVHHHIRFIPVLDAGGTVRAVAAYGRDISAVRAGERERARALEELHRRDQEFRVLVEHAPDPVIRYDRQARRIYVNPAFERVAAARAEALLGRRPAESGVGGPAAGADAQRAIEAVLRDGSTQVVDMIWREPDGLLRAFQVTYVPERDASGEIATVLAVARDISALKRSEEELRKLSRAVEQGTTAVLITDTRGLVEYANPRVTELTGWTSAELLGRRAPLLAPGALPESDRALVEEALRTGGEWRAERELRRKGGAPFWAEISLSPITGAGGATTHFLVVKQDVTRRRQLEEEFRRAQKMEAFGQLAGGVAHDFNNLLTVIGGNVSLLEGALPAAEREACLAQIAEAADRAARLTRQLLLFSRRQPAQLRDLDLNDVAADMARMLRRLIGEHIELETRLTPAGAPVHADLSMMEQVLVNLVVNARDALPRGGRIRLETAQVEGTPERPGSWVCLTVADDGEGIAAEHLPHVFEPFFTTKEVGKGTGLGLATVYGIAAQHGGSIEVESREGEGATFRLYLPRLAGPAGKHGPVAVAPAGGGTEGILLVEDDPAVRSLARRQLTRLGYRVLEAASGDEALELWAAHRDEISLLLTDMVMPGALDGLRLAERLRRDRPHLKVIYSSGYADDMLGPASALRGTLQVLEKPYPLIELARRVRMALDER